MTFGTFGSESREVSGLLGYRALWVGWGLALAVMGMHVPDWDWPPGLARIIGLLVVAGAFVFLAVPYQGRPVLASSRFHHKVRIHRNTVLVCAFVMMVAIGRPQMWETGLDAVLLAGYLLALDAVTMPASVRQRTSGPLFVAWLLALIAVTIAVLELPGSSAPYRKAAAAVAAFAVLGAAVATGFGRANARRVGSRGIEPTKQDRSPR